MAQYHGLQREIKVQERAIEFLNMHNETADTVKLQFIKKFGLVMGVKHMKEKVRARWKITKEHL